MIPFNENRFSFFVADHLLVGQLCTNPKSDRSLLSCLKVTQCSTSEIGDAPLYNSCSLPIQLMTTGPLSAPSSRLESQHQSIPWCAEECGDLLVQSDGRWQTLGVAAELGTGPQVQRDPGLASEGVLRLCTLLLRAPSSSDLNPLDYFVWSYVENITNMTSHNTKTSFNRRHPSSIRQDPAGACGKGMLPVTDPYRGGDWGWRRLCWIDVSSTT